jgi:tetratricopeptide (TPR) repeat protein/cytoskeletal protein CcmA (bactofilin family)
MTFKKDNGNTHTLNSFFGEGTFMRGVLKFKGALRFDGKFEGEILTSDTFIVGNKGLINANIQTGSLLNSGEINGNISAGGKIAIYSEGKLLGNIKTPTLYIQEGAQFNGNCEMITGIGISRESRVESQEAEKIEYSLPHIKMDKRRYAIAAGMIAGILIIFTVYKFADTLNIGETIKNLVRKESPLELMQAGLSQKEQGNKDEAINTFKRLSKLDSNDPDIHLTTARAFMEMGLEDEAISEYDKAINLSPENIETYHEALPLYTKNGMDDKAITALKNIAERDNKDLNIHFNLAALYEKKGMLNDAYHEYKKIVKLAPGNLESLLKLGTISISKGLEDEAVEMFKRIIEINDKNIESHLNLAAIYYRRGLDNDALSEYKKIEEIDPNHIETLNNRGFRAINFEKLDTAAAEFNKVIGTDDKNVRAHLGLAIIYGRRGANEKAVAECKKALEISPRHAPALNRLAWLYAKQGTNIDDGIRLSKDAIQINPQSPEYLDTLSELYYIKGEFDNAIETINKAIGLKPEDLYYKKQLKKFTISKGAKEKN